MNDTVTTEDQEQPAGGRERKASMADRDPGRRTSSGPADISSAPTEAGHMTAADQIVRSAEKCLPRGRSDGWAGAKRDPVFHLAGGTAANSTPLWRRAHYII
jgi:hypothetical protein